MNTTVLTPTNAEHGYHVGWNAFHAGLGYNTNPFSPEIELYQYEGWNNGWSSASVVKVEPNTV